MIGLSRKYMSVDHEGACSFGGSQQWFHGMMKICGCGVIAAADVLWYLHGNKKQPSAEQYDKYVQKVKKSFALFPYRGMPGFWLSICLNLFMIRRGMGYKAHWGAFPNKIGNNIQQMLAQDIPIIFCVGPGFHRIWKKPLDRGLKLYSLYERQYTWTKSVHGHFMVITQMDGDWAKVSSWGEEYYIRISELEDYSSKDGFGLFTNIVCISKRR